MAAAAPLFRPHICFPSREQRGFYHRAKPVSIRKTKFSWKPTPPPEDLSLAGTRTKSFDHSQLQSGWEEGLGVGYLLQVPRQPEMELHPNGRKCVVPRQAGPSTIRFPGPASNYYMISHFKASRTLHIFIDVGTAWPCILFALDMYLLPF